MADTTTLTPMSLREFVGTLKDDCDVPPESVQVARYTLFIGSGCSISSGIPTGTKLVHDYWIPRLHRSESPNKPFDEWLKDRYPDYTPDGAGQFYSEVMAQMFRTPARRQREIENLCARVSPSFEYAQFAALISQERGQFNVVLTTNFDDLVADALYLFARTHPLVIHHASLAEFIGTGMTRPLVVKLHGDNRLSPFNTPEELRRLDDTTKRRVAELIRGRTLIFMGYGGWDEGIADMLSGLETDCHRHGVYWVNDNPPGDRLRDWLEKCHAFHVTPGRFDRVMIEITDPPPFSWTLD